MKIVMLLTKATLYTDVFAGDLGAVELIGAASLTKVRVTFPDSQITRALFRIALRFASASWETILTYATNVQLLFIFQNLRLTIWAALAEFLAKVLCTDARTERITGQSGVVTGRKVVDVVAARIFFQLNLAAMHGPQAVFLLLLPGRSIISHRLFCWNVCCFLLSKVVHLKKTRFLQLAKCTEKIIVANKNSYCSLIWTSG